MSDKNCQTDSTTQNTEIQQTTIFEDMDSLMESVKRFNAARARVWTVTLNVSVDDQNQVITEEVDADCISEALQKAQAKYLWGRSKQKIKFLGGVARKKYSRQD
jgi:hypothetical protein